MDDTMRSTFAENGYLVLRDVLDAETLADLNGTFDEHIRTDSHDRADRIRVTQSMFKRETQAVTDRHGNIYEGRRFWSDAYRSLIDHPRVLGVVTAVLDPDPGRVRLESAFASTRSVAQGPTLDGTTPMWRPHSGGTNLNPSFSYRVQNGRIYAGMTRVVWELNDVVHGKGGTCLMPGSHKAALGTMIHS